MVDPEPSPLIGVDRNTDFDFVADGWNVFGQPEIRTLQVCGDITGTHLPLDAALKIAYDETEGLVTPSMVNCPSAATTLFPSKISLSDLKFIVGYFLTLNKFSSERWLVQSTILDILPAEEAQEILSKLEPELAAKIDLLLKEHEETVAPFMTHGLHHLSVRDDGA